mmetsp:Transcript_33167/g.47984  ORF Transcript_33167/g.47984 Transcript_33167/m.47984 type:complete len:109 (+) Transcript_33167:477-803(+)|eukprot:CAMPEP_0116029526 /NCGR_PEP_ID=MMETSP0321-20121206/16192_1 /TAXON_ID=163516 /ORGANISM="Leptocylindrus danicus var. danicus, Strain B650" /LENGTH=108 /DNA_ID=CAMNT_0003503919 /DNA_START=381 /DNA_END=707 /DNA_ORIENTATION=-
MDMEEQHTVEMHSMREIGTMVTDIVREKLSLHAIMRSIVQQNFPQNIQEDGKMGEDMDMENYPTRMALNMKEDFKMDYFMEKGSLFVRRLASHIAVGSRKGMYPVEEN